MTAKNKPTNNSLINNRINSKIKFKNKETKANDSRKSEINLRESEDFAEKNEEKIKEDFIKEQLLRKEKIYKKMQNDPYEDEEILKPENLLVDFEMKKINEKKLNKTSKVEQDTNIVKEDKFTDEKTNGKEKVLVKQSYDKGLTKDEKTALENIIEEEKEYRSKLELLKKKKNLEREERIERLKRMKI